MKISLACGYTDFNTHKFCGLRLALHRNALMRQGGNPTDSDQLLEGAVPMASAPLDDRPQQFVDYLKRELASCDDQLNHLTNSNQLSPEQARSNTALVNIRRQWLCMEISALLITQSVLVPTIRKAAASWPAI